MIYLDANAHLPQTVRPLKENYGNPNSIHALGRKAAKKIEECREKFANLLGCKSENLFFTHGCTQAAAWGMKILFEKRLKSKIFISKLEHPSILQAYKKYVDQKRFLPVWNFNEKENFEAIGEICFERGNIVCHYVHNETGIIQKLKPEIENFMLFSDISQAIGKIPFSFQDFDPDIAIISCHKFGGSPSVGLLYLKDPSMWLEFDTGSRYMQDCSGTMDTVAIEQSYLALEQALLTLSQRTINMLEFREILETGLEELKFKIIGKEHNRCPNVSFVYAPNLGHKLLFELEKHDVYIGLGSACGSLHSGPSPLMEALNLPGTTGDYIRISQWGNYGIKEAEKVLKIIKEICDSEK
jgi:cysteine desulfurase